MYFRRKYKTIYGYILTIAGFVLIVIWMPLWVWFVITGIILIIIGIDIYNK